MIDRRDSRHEDASNALRQIRGSLATCWPVITEAAWLLRETPFGLEQLMAIIADGTFSLLPLDATDIPPISALLSKYRDLQLQLAGASLLHLANREGIDAIFTFDRRDFGSVRLANRHRPRLIP